MAHVTCRLTAKNRDQLRNPTLNNRVWATFTFYLFLFLLHLFPVCPYYSTRLVSTIPFPTSFLQLSLERKHAKLPVFPTKNDNQSQKLEGPWSPSPKLEVTRSHGSHRAVGCVCDYCCFATWSRNLHGRGKLARLSAFLQLLFPSVTLCK